MEAKDGAIETYYDTGQLKSRANYKDGNRDGLCESWYENGQLKSRANYKDDKLDGLYEYWYENGQQWVITNYKNDKLDGLYEYWYENGQQWVITNYKNDKLNGLYETWYPTGQRLVKETYKDGAVMLTTKHEQSMVEQESDRIISKEEKLLLLERENLALKIMVLRDRQLAHEITFKESLKQSTSLIEEYEKNKIGNYGKEEL